MKPLIITAALVGGELTREKQPYLPLTPEEIIQSGIAAHQAGASILHLHVRNSEGKPTCDEKIFRKVIEGIRKSANPIIQVSTGGSIGDSEEDRFRPLESNPEMASLNTGSINFGEDVFLNPLPFIQKMAEKMLQKKIRPEVEIFDTAMLETALNLINKEFIPANTHFQFVLGVPGGLAATERNLKFLIGGIPENIHWTVSAIGRYQFAMLELTIQLGGHARVGFEDNIFLEKGVLAKTNAELVTKVVEIAKKYHRPVASIKEAREILELT